MYEGGLAEPDLGLGGVDVNIDLLGRHIEEEEDDWKRGGWDDIAVSLGEGMEDEAIADEAVIDEDIDGVAVELLELGLRNEAGDTEVAGVCGLVVFFALPRRGLGEAGAAEVELGGNREHECRGVAAKDLEEAV